MRFPYFSLVATGILLTGASCNLLNVKTPTDRPANGITDMASTPSPTSANTIVPLPGDQMPLDTTRRPGWLDSRIQKLQANDRPNSPAQIYRYTYKGQVVYYETTSGADQFSTLYDTAGTTLCHPDGGLTGKGDGNCPDFEKRRTGGVLVWSDQR